MLRELDPVVLQKNIPSHGLRTGDLGTVVGVYSRDGHHGIHVEFVNPNGTTRALLILDPRDVRKPRSTDVATVRTA
jgi:hypothetical protein